MHKQILLIAILVIIGINIWAQNVLDCIPVVKNVENQINQVVVGGNNGSGIFVWQDARDGNYNIYAQRIDNSGHMLWLDHIKGKIIATGASNKINVSDDALMTRVFASPWSNMPLAPKAGWS
jgi:predicted MPP superfamily phosphohydrolase